MKRKMQAGGRYRSLTRFRVAQEGASAIEFALIAIPFFFLLLATLELGLIFVANMSLQNATFAAARQIRVGELAAAGKYQTSSNGGQVDLADFKAMICQNMPLAVAGNCNSHLYLDVRELPGFTGSMTASPYTGKTLDASSFCFYSGASGSIVQMRAYYLWPVFTPLLLDALVNTTSVVDASGTTSDNWFALSSYEVFRNEPGSGLGNTGAGC